MQMYFEQQNPMKKQKKNSLLNHGHFRAFNQIVIFRSSPKWYPDFEEYYYLLDIPPFYQGYCRFCTKLWQSYFDKVWNVFLVKDVIKGVKTLLKRGGCMLFNLKALIYWLILEDGSFFLKVTCVSGMIIYWPVNMMRQVEPCLDIWSQTVFEL